MAPGVISWPAICGSNDSIFWDQDLTFNTSRPQLSPCFQGTAVPWTECALLWLSAAFYLPWLLKKSAAYRCSDRTGIYMSKLFFSICLIIISIVDLISTILQWYRGEETPLYMLIAPVILIISFILVGVLQHLEFTKGLHTSGVFFMFWLVKLVLDSLTLTSIIIQITDYDGIHTTLHVVTFSISYACVLAQFILCLLVDIPKVSSAEDRYGRGISDERTPLLFSNSASPIAQRDEDRHREPCLEEKASFPSLILHMWIFPLIVRGFRTPLTFENLPNIMNRDRTRTIIGLFNKEWARQLQPSTESSSCCRRRSPSPNPSLLFALIKASWQPYTISAIVRLIGVGTEFLNPLLLQAAIDLLGGNDPNYLWKGVALAFIIFFSNCANSMIIQTYFKYIYLTAMHARTAITAAVYRKALRLTPAARKTTTVGEIVNLMSVDAEKIQEAFQDCHEIWAGPMTAAIAMYFLWQIIGPSAMAGAVFLLVLMPFAGYWQVTKYAELQDEQMKQKDNRIRLINEILSGIKVLKMYAWELSFKQNVTDIRQKELKALRYQTYLYIGVSVAWLCAPTLVSLCIFTTYILSSSENYLDPTKAFVSMNVIQVLNFSISFLAIWLAMAAQAYTSLKRISRVLQEPELDDDVVVEDLMMDQALLLDDATFSYGPEENEKAVLRNIKMEVGEGELVAVVGQVGCGKSSLVQAMLGELHKIEGLIKIKGSVAYIPQQAWIQNDTLKNNILFGKKIDQSRYEKVVEACALKPDLDILPGGDRTEIGEKGINLSGGQKQRISLARAVYQNKDIYLLDDPLSAVDAHVGKHLFDMVIGPDGCLKRKTRVLVTHGLTYLPYVDRIVVLVDGKISETGTYKQLMDHDGAFAEFVRQYNREVEGEEEEGEEEKEKEGPEGEQTPALSDDPGPHPGYVGRQLSALMDTPPSTPVTPTIAGSPSRSSSVVRPHRISRIVSQVDDDVDAKGVKAQIEKMQAERIIEEEAAEVGTIKWAVVKMYIGTWGVDIVVSVLISLLAYMASITIEQIWLSAWSDDPIPDDIEDGRKQSEYRLGIYGALNVALMVTTALLGLFMKLGCLRASRILHTDLLCRILRAPMAFFDTTPLGRIVNRFSTDVDKVDATIPDHMVEVLYYVAQVFATFIVISYSTPFFLITIPVFIFVFVAIQRLYMAGVRQMKRIDSIRRSPIYANFDETLVGVSCIRAFRQQERFILKNDRLVDDSQIAWYPVTISQRWLGVSLECVGAAIIFFAIILAVVERETISPGTAALSISIAMQSYWCLSQMVRGATDLETYIVSVERIKEYSEITSEAAWELESTKPPLDWPHEGRVKFEGYSTRYRPGLDYVLKDLSLSISSSEKVGIVGRTGAGKSSIALSLFRIIEAAAGKITVDGLDLSTLGLHQLRSKLTIIPQDPVLFSGSLRHNMDPFLAYTDDEIWKALELAHLKTFVSGLDEGLQYECGESGQNLSVGQRQLVCLARALLRRSRVLLLDEATAAVDLETDELIQATIRTAFKECTVLTIAHRINTIMDYDRVLVLDAGQIKEFAPPSELIQNPDSTFYGLAKDANLVA